MALVGVLDDISNFSNEKGFDINGLDYKNANKIIYACGFYLSSFG
jgi:hypothetical protein